MVADLSSVLRRGPVVAFILALAFGLMSPGGAKAAQTPEEAWRQAISGQNSAYAKKPHAMLKIQDSVYLDEGQSAQLLGRTGKPDSWHWSRAADARGVLSLSVRNGELTVRHRGRPVAPDRIKGGLVIDKDVDVAGQPTQVGAGVTGWRIFVYNQKTPAARAFGGVSYFPYDPAFRVSARFQPDAGLPPRVFRTSRGTDKQFYHAGDAVFTLADKEITLPFYADGNDPARITELSAFFTDTLTGDGAYEAGRYVDIDGFSQFPPSSVVIDFNLAYNPNCARSPHFTCPIAVYSIDLPLKAGERDPHAAP